MNETHGHLISESGCSIPLLGVRVEGSILGRGARVKLSQVFRNREDRAMEAVYKFPLPEGAAVCGFRALVDGRTIRGMVEERDKAFEMYDNALSRGDGAYLLDEERPNIFTLSVGGLNPWTEVMIEIEYVTLLDVERNQARFFLPTTIAPRYIPDGVDETRGVPENSTLHPPYARNVPYGLAVSLDIHKGGLLRSIRSPSHPVHVNNMKGDPVHVAFSAESVLMDRDFILDMEFEPTRAGMAYLYREGEECFLQLDLLLEGESRGTDDSTDLHAKEDAGEIVFVLDCSGSMSGDSIREAKKALGVCLKGLDPSVSFNIYRFGSDHECLYEKTEKYSSERLEEGLAYLRKAEADLGGTEILKPLKAVADGRYDMDHGETNIVLMTDGEVANEEDVFELVRRNRDTTRVFSIGIGAGCNEYFIKGLARAGRGSSEFIHPGERIEPKVLRLFSRITQRGLDDLEIQWGQGLVEQAPEDPPVFLGSPATLFARCGGHVSPNERITVRGQVNGRNMTWDIEMVTSHAESAPVSTLWARERIRDLEESAEGLHVRGSRQKEKKVDQWHNTILSLSKKYNLLSRSTSYVAMEEREEKDKTTGELVLRKVPVMVTSGWHGMGGVFEPAPPADVLYDTVSDSFAIEEDMVFNTEAFDSFELDYDIFPRMKAAPDDKTDRVLAILALQKAEGGMVLDEKVCQDLGLDHDLLVKIAADIQVNVEVDRPLLVATAVFLKVLDIVFSSQRGTWAGIVKKSTEWLNHVVAEVKPTLHGQDIVSWAEVFVRDNVRA